MIGRCATCKRQLDLEGDPISGNTGGDCWGCVGHMEALCGGDPQQNISIGFIAKEIDRVGESATERRSLSRSSCQIRNIGPATDCLEMTALWQLWPLRRR